VAGFYNGNPAKDSLSISIQPSSDPSLLDEIHVNGVRYGIRGFDPIAFAPGGAAIECFAIGGCSKSGWLWAGVGTLPFASAEGGAAKGAIGWTGQIGENALKQLGGESQAFFRTSQGAPYVDRLVNGVANESKVGYQTLTQNLASQISKDIELIQSGQIQGATWHFLVSPVTGVGGPSGPLAAALRQAGIDIIIH